MHELSAVDDLFLLQLDVALQECASAQSSHNPKYFMCHFNYSPSNLVLKALNPHIRYEIPENISSLVSSLHNIRPPQANETDHPLAKVNSLDYILSEEGAKLYRALGNSNDYIFKNPNWFFDLHEFRMVNTNQPLRLLETNKQQQNRRVVSRSCPASACDQELEGGPTSIQIEEGCDKDEFLKLPSVSPLPLAPIPSSYGTPQEGDILERGKFLKVDLHNNDHTEHPNGSLSVGPSSNCSSADSGLASLSSTAAGLVYAPIHNSSSPRPAAGGVPNASLYLAPSATVTTGSTGSQFRHGDGLLMGEPGIMGLGVTRERLPSCSDRSSEAEEEEAGGSGERGSGNRDTDTSSNSSRPNEYSPTHLRDNLSCSRKTRKNNSRTDDSGYCDERSSAGAADTIKLLMEPPSSLGKTKMGSDNCESSGGDRKQFRKKRKGQGQHLRMDEEEQGILA
jgi:hypothetical protein